MKTPSNPHPAEANEPDLQVTPSVVEEPPATIVTGTGKRVSWRRNLYAVWIAQLFAIMAFSMRTPFTPMFLGEIGVKTREAQAMWAGLVLSGGALMMAITAPIWGAMADRRGRKLMLLRAQFGAFIMIGATAFVMSAPQLLALRIVEGGLTGTVTAATALVAATMPKERLGYGLGMVQTAIFSGSALGPLVGGVIADAVGYRETFMIAAFMMLIAGLITLFFVVEDFVPPPAPTRRVSTRRQWASVLSPVMILLCLSMLSIRFAAGAEQPITPLFVSLLAGTKEGASTLAGLSLGILGVTSAVSSVVFGRVGDRRGHANVLIGCALAAGMIYFPIALSRHPWQLIALQAMFGVFAGGMMPSANALVANASDASRRGVVFGLTNTMASIGGFLGPLAGSSLAAAFGFRWTYALTGITLIGMATSLWAVRKRLGLIRRRSD